MRTLLFRNLVATILIPGTVAGVIPCLIVPSEYIATIELDAVSYAGIAAIAIGAASLLWSIVAFATEGQGTLAPIDPPTRLVRTGLYRYVRNPMYAGVLLILSGEVLLVRSLELLIYAAGFFFLANLVVMLYEEPTLRRTFGREYDDYCRRVRRWGIV